MDQEDLVVVDRRTFIAIAAAWLAAPRATEAQQAGKIPRIGFLGLNSTPEAQHLLEALRQGLRERGWVEGQNIAIEYRFAEGRAERLPTLAAELVNLPVDLIVVAATQSIEAAKNATRTIPIVMAFSGNPVSEGFVAGLARPGGNLTGLTGDAGPEIAGKQLELLTQIVPQVLRVTVLLNPANRSHGPLLREVQAAAHSLRVQVQVLQAGYPEQLDGAFAAMTMDRASAVLLLSDAMFFGQRGRIADLAAKSRLPAMYARREYVDAGGLMAYGASPRDNFHRTATYVDKILKGAEPADLPIEQPKKFELVINLKTAKALGLTIPPSVLLRADQVIE